MCVFVVWRGVNISNKLEFYRFLQQHVWYKPEQMLLDVILYFQTECLSNHTNLCFTYAFLLQLLNIVMGRNLRYILLQILLYCTLMFLY